MQRWAFLAYAAFSYLLFLAVYAYMAGFVGNIVVPKTIDSGDAGPAVVAAAVNVGLILLFGLQHSVMARPAFKRVWTRLVPAPIERSTYLVASFAALALLMWLWQPMPAVVWDVPAGPARTAMWGLFAAGWLMVPLVSLMINHFDLFGLRQVWLHFRGREYTSLPFRVAMLYRHVRHPLYIGWALAFWATPTMTAGHLLFAGVQTAYMALAARIEEQDLVDHFGGQYEEYRRTVPMFVPGLCPRAAAVGDAPPAAAPVSRV